MSGVPPTLEVACPTCGALPGQPCLIEGTPEGVYHSSRFRMAQVGAHVAAARYIARNMHTDPLANAVLNLCQAFDCLAGVK